MMNVLKRVEIHRNDGKYNILNKHYYIAYNNYDRVIEYGMNHPTGASPYEGGLGLFEF